MQNQLHALDPSLRSGSISSTANNKSQTQHFADANAQSYSPIQPSPTSSHHNIQTPSYYTTAHHAQESPEEESPSAQNPHDPNDLKRPRACEACRQLKVKCELDDSNPGAPCKRCAKARRQCIITAPSRKRQKKTDSRVAELEKKIDALTASLAARGATEADGNLDPAMSRSQYQHPGVADSWSYNSQQLPQHLPIQSPQGSAQLAGAKRRHPDDIYNGDRRASVASAPAHHAAYNEPPSRYAAEPSTARDVIEDGVIDAATAYRCFERYRTEMCQLLPIVVFPPGVSAEDVRRTKPILFLAVISAAVGTIRPDLQSRLNSEAAKTLAHRVIYSGEKTMELVQTIQVMTVFYQPPERYEELNFNQLIHIGAVMAMDIGMGKRSRKAKLAVWKTSTDKNKIPDPSAAETRRCWLGNYYMCSNSSMSLRRPFLVRWSPYADECVDILDTAPDALPSDKWLCHIVRTQRMAEEVSGAFFMDDAAKEVSLTDPNVQKQLEEFERELNDWRNQSVPDMTISPIMQHTEGIIDLYMHEIAMHNEHNVDDFRPPYHATPIEGPPNPETPQHLKSLGVCLRSAHAVFDAFLSMDVQSLRSLPTLFFVRTSYAAVALIKMYTAIAAKDSNFGKLCKTEDLKVDYYLERLIATLTKVAEGGMSKVAYKFSLIFNMLKSWHVRRTEPAQRQSKGDSGQRASQKATSRATKNSTNQPSSVSTQIKDGHQKQQVQPASQLWQPNNGQVAMSQSSQQRNGLQMLSDAAMAPNAHMAAGGQDHWMSPPPPPSQQQPIRQGSGSQSGMGSGMESSGMMSADPTMMAGLYGLPNDQMALMDFTSDELMAYGFGDEFMAMNFGFDQGGPEVTGGGGWAI